MSESEIRMNETNPIRDLKEAVNTENNESVKINKRKRKSLPNKENVASTRPKRHRDSLGNKENVPISQSTPHQKPLTEIQNEIETARFIKEEKRDVDLSLNQIDEVVNKSMIKTEYEPKDVASLSLLSNDWSPITENETKTVHLSLDTSLHLEPALAEFRTTVVIANRTAPVYNNGCEIVIEETNTLLKESNQNQTWNENLKLIMDKNKRRESFISSTPSKISFDLTHRVYHQHEDIENANPYRIVFEKAELIQSFTSPLVQTVEKELVAVNEGIKQDEENIVSNSLDFEEEVANVNNYAADLIKTYFTVDEIKNGIFPNKFNSTTSKTQTPFSEEKTQDFKDELCTHFLFDEEKMETIWNLIRPKLNKKLGEIRRKNK